MAWMCGVVAALAAGAWLTGCASAPQSSRLGVSDIEHTAVELGAKLGESDFLRGRTPESPRVVVAITKVENLTTDLIPESDRWYIMARVRDSRGLEPLRRLRNVVFVMPAEHLRGHATPSEFDLAFASGRQPTHEMEATFRSATRTAGRDRTDYYQCEMRITSLDTREVAWTDVVEFKKAAFGKAYD